MLDRKICERWKNRVCTLENNPMNVYLILTKTRSMDSGADSIFPSESNFYTTFNKLPLNHTGSNKTKSKTTTKNGDNDHKDCLLIIIIKKKT